MGRAHHATPPVLGTYRDGVGVERCRRCLQVLGDCFCTRPYWCTWCWKTDGRAFYAHEPRCCIACLQLGRSARRDGAATPDADA